MTKKSHPWLILGCMVVGLALGLLTNVLTGGTLTGLADILNRLSSAIGSTVFIGLLKVLVVPLIFTTIFLVVSDRSSAGRFGKSLRMVLLYYVATSTIAVCISLTIANVVRPGVTGDGTPMLKELAIDTGEAATNKATSIIGNTGEYGQGYLGIFEVFLKQLIPQNAFQALSSNGSLLAIIFLAGLFGFAAAKVPKAQEVLTPVMDSIKDVIQWLIEAVLKIAPLGVFCLAFASASAFGLEQLRSVAVYFFAVILCLVIHASAVLIPAVWLIGRMSPAKFLSGMRSALLTAFSTSSSAATLPVTTRCLNTNLKVSERSTSMVLPMGTTINMDGTALYECFAVLFVAQGLGYDLSLGSQLVVVILAIATSIGVAPVPSASLVAIALILENVGVPGSAAAIGLLYAIDRPLDMLRTSVNIMGDSVGAVIYERKFGQSTA